MEETISNIPIPIKNILNFIDKLIDKKMSQSKDIKKITYFKLMSKLKIIIGNLIIPILDDYHKFRILNERILSLSTSEVLKNIIKIFNTILSGKLFDNSEDPEFTIYNKYIINVLPKLFKLSLSIGKSISLSNARDSYSSIFQKLINSFDKINDNKRITNYNGLKDKKEYEQNLLYQSICFNWDILYTLVKIINDEKKLFISNKNSKQANKVFEDILDCHNKIEELYKIDNEKKNLNFFLLIKLYIKKSLSKE